MIFAHRTPYRDRLSTVRDAERYDRYLCGRARYRRGLVETIVRRAGDGPVLDLGPGFGSIGIEVARRGVSVCVVYRHEWARQVQLRRFDADGLAGRCRLVAANDGSVALDGGGFRVAYSCNLLHTYDEPARLFDELRRLSAPGGTVLVNDVKRDANPYIVEFVLRESESERSDDGDFAADTFVATLRSAYSTGEVAACLAGAGVTEYRLDREDPVTFTVEFTAGERP